MNPHPQQEIDGVIASMTTMSLRSGTILEPNAAAMYSMKMLDILSTCGTVKILDNTWLEDENRTKQQTSAFVSDVMGEAQKSLQAVNRALVEITGPSVILGNIHGDWNALHSFLDTFFTNPRTATHNLVCIGGYTDGGTQNIAVLTKLFALRALYPTKVFLLRGNHEYPMTNSSNAYSFRKKPMCILQECLQYIAGIPAEDLEPFFIELDYLNIPVFDMIQTPSDRASASNPSMVTATSKTAEILMEFADEYPLCVQALQLYYSICRCYAWLPISAIVNDKVLVVNGGIPSTFLTAGPHACFENRVEMIKSVPLPYWDWYQVSCIPGMTKMQYRAFVSAVFDVVHSTFDSHNQMDVFPQTTIDPLSEENVHTFLSENSDSGHNLQCIIRADVDFHHDGIQNGGKVITLGMITSSELWKSMCAIVSAEGEVEVIKPSM
jgi:Calcineurin-like phosphoesterase